MNMLIVGLFLPVAFLAAGCTTKISGQLSANKDFEVTNVAKQSEVIPAGQYEVEIEASRKTSKISLKNVENKLYKFEVRSPKGLMDPDYTGPIEISANDLGQPFGLNGQVINEVTQTPQYQTVRQCVHHWDWQLECRGGDHGPDCYYVRVPVWGHRVDLIYDLIRRKSITLNIVKIAERSPFGLFGAKIPQATQTVTVQEGQCRL